jgi:hypothetical protein
MRLFEIGHVFSMSDPGEATLVENYRKRSESPLTTGNMTPFTGRTLPDG